MGGSRPDVVTGTADVRGKTVFVFPGQGSQWTGMAIDLIRQSPAFAARMAECDAALARVHGLVGARGPAR